MQRQLVVAATATLVALAFACTGDDSSARDTTTTTVTDEPQRPPEPREPSVEFVDDAGLRFRVWAEEPVLVSESGSEGIPDGYASVFGRYVLQNLQERQVPYPSGGDVVVAAVGEADWEEAFKIGAAELSGECVADGLPPGFCRLPAEARSEQGFDTTAVRIDETLRVDLLVGETFVADELGPTDVHVFFVGDGGPVQLWPPP